MKNSNWLNRPDILIRPWLTKMYITISYLPILLQLFEKDSLFSKFKFNLSNYIAKTSVTLNKENQLPPPARNNSTSKNNNNSSLKNKFIERRDARQISNLEQIKSNYINNG